MGLYDPATAPAVERNVRRYYLEHPECSDRAETPEAVVDVTHAKANIAVHRTGVSGGVDRACHTDLDDCD